MESTGDGAGRRRPCERRRGPPAGANARGPAGRGLARFGTRCTGQDRRAGRHRAWRDRAAAVLGRRKGAPRVSAIDTAHFRERLVDERRRVIAAIQNLHNDHPGTLSDESGEEAAYDNHLLDTATETYDRELDYTLEENSGHVLAEIDAALKRIDDGTYGICTSKGEQIPVERLEALPWATLCIDCQRQQGRR